MNAQETHTDVVIVGGGLAGLTAACYLARAGTNVTLLEKSADTGGRAATQDHVGYKFNRGIHALYTGGALSEVLAEFGVQYSGQTPVKLYALRDSTLHAAPYNVPTMLRTRLLSAADKLDLMHVFSVLPRLKAHEFTHVSLASWLERVTRRPVVRQFLASFARTGAYSSALELVSTDLFIVRMQTTMKHPVVYIDGGWQTLADGLRHTAQKAGARIQTSGRVEAVEVEDGAARGVRLSDGTIIRANSVILALMPKDAAALVDEVHGHRLRAVTKALIPAQLACLDVAVSRLPQPDYAIVQDIDRPCFMSVQSLYSRVAPEGGALIYAFKQLDPTAVSDPREDERDLEHLLDTAQPGWRDVVVKRQFMPRIDALGALPLARTGGLPGRPSPDAAGIAGLYLAGDWVGAEGLLADASAASARLVARRILERTNSHVAARSRRDAVLV